MSDEQETRKIAPAAPASGAAAHVELEESLRRTREFLRKLAPEDEASRRYVEEVENSLSGRLVRLGKDSPHSSYVIDVRDRLITCDAGWNRAAAEYAAGCTSDQVLGRSLWEFFSDPATERLHRNAVRAARGGRTVSLAFRCDLPEERRAFDLAVRPSGSYGAGSVRFTVRLVKSVPRPSVRFPGIGESIGTDTDDLLGCSWCSRFNLGPDGWAELEEAVARLDGRFPSVRLGICPGCHDAASRSIGL